MQDLRCALQKTRSELQAKEAALKENVAERHVMVQEKERSITQLKHSLQEKDQQLQVTRGAYSFKACVVYKVDMHTFLVLSENSSRSMWKCWSQREAPNQEMLCWRN